PASTTASTRPLLLQDGLDVARRMPLPTPTQPSERKLPVLFASHGEVRDECLTDNLRERSPATLSLARDDRREVVGKGDRGAHHTRIIPQRLVPARARAPRLRSMKRP